MCTFRNSRKEKLLWRKKKKKTFFRTIPVRASQGIVSAAMTVALMMPAPPLAEFVPVEETPSFEETNFVEVSGRQEESQQSFRIGSGEVADLRPVLKPMSSITESEVRNKLTTCTSCWPGRKWDERNGLGKQCYAFAHYVFNSIFGWGNTSVGSYSGSTQYKFDNPKSDIRTIGTVTPSGGLSDFSSLLSQAAPGDCIQM